MLCERLIWYLLMHVLLVLFGWISLFWEIQPSQSNQSEQQTIRPVAQKPRVDYRQALAIGNADYDYADVLRNPVNDAD
jgi:hypothetical protein